MNEPKLVDRATLCTMLGGSRPTHASTLYGLIKRRVLPAPVKVGGSSRWKRDEVEACLQAMIAKLNVDGGFAERLEAANKPADRHLVAIGKPAPGPEEVSAKALTKGFAPFRRRI